MENLERLKGSGGISLIISPVMWTPASSSMGRCAGPAASSGSGGSHMAEALPGRFLQGFTGPPPVGPPDLGVLGAFSVEGRHQRALRSLLRSRRTSPGMNKPLSARLSLLRRRRLGRCLVWV